MGQTGYGLWIKYNDTAIGWAGWAPEFGSSVNPITIRGADYAHHITASPPGFENPAAALVYLSKAMATVIKIDPAIAV